MGIIYTDATAPTPAEQSDGQDVADALNAISGNGVVGFNSVFSAVKAFSQTKKSGMRIAFCGDSITDDSDDGDQWNDWGWVAWFRRLLAQHEIEIEHGDIYAVASMGTTHLLNTQLPAVLADGGYDAVFTMIGTNDLGSAVDIKSNLTAFHHALRDAGVISVALPVLPHSSPNSYSTTLQRQVDDVNRHLQSLCADGGMLRFVNTVPDFMDGSTGDAVTGYLRDGIHMTKQGAKVFAESVYDGVPDFFVKANPMFPVVNNLYDETTYPRGDFLANGRMLGDSGILQNGATGDVADNWALGFGAAGASWALVGAKGVTDNGSPYQEITFTGTGDNKTFSFFSLSVQPPSGVNDGDVVEMLMDVELIDLSGVGYLAPDLKIGASTFYRNGSTTTANGNYPANFRGVFTVKGPYISGETFNARITGASVNGQEISGSVRIYNVQVRKLS